MKRRGVSLIELMVVIAIISVLFGMVGVVFHRLFLSEQTAMRAAQIERSTSRLADQFRRDIHAASRAERDPSGDSVSSSLKLTSDSADSPTIVYSTNEDGVSRQVIVDGLVARREQYRLPECPVRIVISSDQAETRMVTLVIERQGSTITPQPQAVRPRRSLPVEAVLGRDAALAGALGAKSATTAKGERR